MAGLSLPPNTPADPVLPPAPQEPAPSFQVERGPLGNLSQTTATIIALAITMAVITGITMVLDILLASGTGS
jgi:hypothetical protein